tara:strand:- start:23 stop:250 length:228 start_codon:yes stop_codon:yes gene_type:complete
MNSDVNITIDYDALEDGEELDLDSIPSSIPKPVKRVRYGTQPRRSRGMKLNRTKSWSPDLIGDVAKGGVFDDIPF